MRLIQSTQQRIPRWRYIMILAVLSVVSIISAICMSAFAPEEDAHPIDDVAAPVSIQLTESLPTSILITPDEKSESVSEWQPTAEDVEALAKTLYGECRGVESKAEQAAVAWCILNRVDSPKYPDTIICVVTQPYQFAGYDDAHPVRDDLEQLAIDVLIRWHNEQQGEINVGRTLPKAYLFFTGDGERNHFTIEWRGKIFWDWSLKNPYDSLLCN